jgi:hypothetical protein
VERVLADVPPNQRCRCREEKAKTGESSATSSRKARFRGLFGK